MIEGESFRDPAGTLRVAPTQVLRKMQPQGAQELRAFLASETAQRWQKEGRLVDAKKAGVEDGLAVFASPRIAFASYAHEWPPEMLHAAASLTLDLAQALVRDGRELKDATPTNVLFEGPSPVFVDLASVRTLDAGARSWDAYAQLVRTFLIPLLLARRDPRVVAEIFLARRDGMDPADALRRLSAWERLTPAALGLVTLPAVFSRRAAPVAPRPSLPDAERARFVRGYLLGGLARRTRALAPRPRESHWSRYEETTHYDAAARDAKDAFVQRVLAAARPAWTLDVGANTGRYSLMAAKAGSRVVAIDSDAACMGELWRRATRERADVLPLVVDIARPTPALGWGNAEEASFLARAQGRFDLVFMLAILHHLLVQERIPLDRIADLAAHLTRRDLVLEYVDPSDPMFRQIARGRDALHASLDLAATRSAFARRFTIVHEAPVGATRQLMHLRRRDDGQAPA